MQQQLTAQQQRAMQILSQIPDDAAAMAFDDVMSGQKTVIPRFYWSTVRFLTTLSAGVFSISQRPRTFFNYKVGDPLDAAGFAPGTIATRAETSLTVQGSTTEDNADAIVWGMGCELCSNNQQPDLAMELFRQLDLIMSLSSTTKIYLGPAVLYPCPGGLSGYATSKLQQGATENNLGAQLAQMTNGLPAQGNLRKLPSPWRWNSIGSNKKDTALQISATPQQIVSVTATPAHGAGVDPIQTPAWALPTADATYVDLRMYLQLIEISSRSDNV